MTDDDLEAIAQEARFCEETGRATSLRRIVDALLARCREAEAGVKWHPPGIDPKKGHDYDGWWTCEEHSK